MAELLLGNVEESVLDEEISEFLQRYGSLRSIRSSACPRESDGPSRC